MVFNRRKWQVVEETRGDNATVVIRGWADSRGWSSGDISEMVYLMDRLWTSAIQCYLRSSLMLYIQDQRTVSIYMNAINYGDWQITVTYNPVYARSIPVLNLLDPQWIVYSSVYSVLQLTLTQWRRACRNFLTRTSRAVRTRCVGPVMNDRSRVSLGKAHLQEANRIGPDAWEVSDWRRREGKGCTPYTPSRVTGA